jgi:hypothetical protein
MLRNSTTNEHSEGKMGRPWTLKHMVRVVTILLEILPMKRNSYRQEIGTRLSMCISPAAENRSINMPRGSRLTLNSDRAPLHDVLCLVSVYSNKISSRWYWSWSSIYLANLYPLFWSDDFTSSWSTGGGLLSCLHTPSPAQTKTRASPSVSITWYLCEAAENMLYVGNNRTSQSRGEPPGYVLGGPDIRNLIKYLNKYLNKNIKPITVAARSKTWNNFVRSNNGIMGSNATRGMEACPRFFCVYVVLCR